MDINCKHCGSQKLEFQFRLGVVSQIDIYTCEECGKTTNVACESENLMSSQDLKESHEASERFTRGVHVNNIIRHLKGDL